MRNPAAQGKRDANQADLVAVFENMGCTVLDLSHVGGGCPDLLVATMGRNYLVECKTRKGKMRKTQIQFEKNWNGGGVWCVRDANDVINLVNEWRLNHLIEVER